MYSLGHCHELSSQLLHAPSLDDALGMIEFKASLSSDQKLPSNLRPISPDKNAAREMEMKVKAKDTKTKASSLSIETPFAASVAAIASSAAQMSSNSTAFGPDPTLYAKPSLGSTSNTAQENKTWVYWLSDLPLAGLQKAINSHCTTLEAMRDKHRYTIC